MSNSLTSQFQIVPHRPEMWAQPVILDSIFKQLSPKVVSILRGMDSNWENVGIHHVKKKAAAGQVNKISLLFTAEMTPLEFKTKIVEFFNDTVRIRCCFFNLEVSFPQIVTHSSRYIFQRIGSIPINGIHLEIPENFVFSSAYQRVFEKLLHKLQPTLQNLIISIGGPSNHIGILTPSFLAGLPFGPIPLTFPHLFAITFLRGETATNDARVEILSKDIINILFKANTSMPALEWIDMFKLPQSTLCNTIDDSFFHIAENLTKLEISNTSGPISFVSLLEFARGLSELGKRCRLNELSLELVSPHGENNLFQLTAERFTTFFASQSSSLLIFHLKHQLVFTTRLAFDEAGFAFIPQIAMPFFERIVEFGLKGRSILGIVTANGMFTFDPFIIASIPANFYMMKTFHFGGEGWQNRGPNFLTPFQPENIDEDSHYLDLDSLVITEWAAMSHENWVNLQLNFRIILSLTCPLRFLSFGPLMSRITVKELHLREINANIGQFIALFDNLEQLFIEEDNLGSWPAEYFGFLNGIVHPKLTLLIIRGTGIPIELETNVRNTYPKYDVICEEMTEGWLRQ